MSKPRVFVSRIIPDAGLDKVKAACDADIWPERLPPPREVLLERVRGVDGILCVLTERIDGELLDAAGPQLKVVSQMAVGYDNIDITATKARNIPVGNTPGVLTDATADLAFALLLAVARRIVEGVEYIRNGEWQTWEPKTLLGADVTGATLGVVGFGRIGRAMAKRASGFDMNILAYSPSLTDEEAEQAGVKRADLETLLRESDFVSVHAPLNAKTKHLINRETLALMKSSAILVNSSRGGLVDQVALYDALTSGTIRAAGLDVTDPEPLASDHPLMKLPNVVIVPHIGSASVRTRDRMASMAADNLLAGLKGEPLPNQVK